MITAYRYNTLDQVVAQKIPDAGQSHFWYDRLGRIVASQNAKQILNNNYSYTLYDDLGRITEVGELTSGAAMTDDVSRKASALNSWMNAVSSTRTQITKTVYDQALTPFGGELWNPVNLRNRVSWSAVYNTYADVLGGDYVTGSFYSYDILGNVKTLLQDYKTIITSNQADRWKRISYDYDLVSGKVNMVSYQPGGKDAFYHRYSYDAENRITGVATSHDSVYWENDAYYQYYKHGPLARTIIGQQQVQGVDYAYTLQGWLKGVNSTALTPAYDMGGDGSMVARDAYGFALHYYGSEYTPVNSAKSPFAAAPVSKPLYNGNITAISQHLPTLGTPLLSSYSYDVLNRLVGMQVSNGLNTGTNTWTPVAIDDYKEKVTYDANGNILTYSRNGNKTDKPMDRLAYNYKAGKNQLDFITDSVTAARYDTDIDSQLSGNYAYDAIGNLVKDSAGGISEIKWTLYGKIASIKKADNTIISYAYDVAGNRISKKVNNVQTWYVRDASGNVMSIYTKGDATVNGGALTQTEVDLFGSSRLGINTLTTNVETANSGIAGLTGLGNGININFIRGKKFFELSNHLGNVLATVSDKKLSVSVNGSVIDYYIADIVSAQEYYPFGMQMPGRGISSSKYRYGFNGKENDNEINGEGNSLDFGARIYDPRIGRFLSVDPDNVKYPFQSPYINANNSPVFGVDVEGKGFGYGTLLFLAKQSKSAIAVSIGGSVSYGVGMSAARGMAVDAEGNFALFYGATFPSADKNTVNINKVGFSSSLTANLQILPNRQIDAIPGGGFSFGGSAFAPNGLGVAGSADFTFAGDNKHTEFLGLTIGVGVGVPGATIGFNGTSITFAALYSAGDYKTLFDTKWDEMGVAEAQEWTDVVNNGNLNKPVGFWSYSGSSEVYEPVPGHPNNFSVSIKQDFHFNTSGDGASQGMTDTQISKIIPTGIIMIQDSKTTLKSQNYKKPDYKKPN